MKGYYVIPTNGDIIEISGKGSKNKAIKIARALYENGDSSVFVQKYNDDNEEGYLCGEEMIRFN